MSGRHHAVDQLLAECRALGWRVERRRKHWSVYAPGTIIVIPCTPSDHRNILNCRALVRQAQRKEAPCPATPANGSRRS